MGYFGGTFFMRKYLVIVWMWGISGGGQSHYWVCLSIFPLPYILCISYCSSPSKSTMFTCFVWSEECVIYVPKHMEKLRISLSLEPFKEISTVERYLRVLQVKKYLRMNRNFWRRYTRQKKDCLKVGGLSKIKSQSLNQLS